ncbi:MAG TPA: GNAT family N-acetyltransferase [Gaiellaceae bacterium]|nr:GNAT family N-acetyltransferase [Gaiellaceae bacterium]
MEVVRPRSVEEWLDRARPLLLADEARHNLILGLAGTLRDHPEYYPDFGLWLVEADGAAVAAALRTRPHNLVLGRGPDRAVALLARSIEEELPGVVGAVPEVDAFVTAAGRDAVARVRQRIFALRAVIAPPRPPGRARPATVADRELLLRWWREFVVEAIGDEDPDPDGVARNVDHRLGARDAGIALWEDEGRPVSAVGWGAPTPSGIRIGPVYTPPEARGRGYASALTAHVSQEQLDRGRAFCFLYTDLANPTSNKIYAAIGYEPVADSIEYAFT